MKLPPWCVPWLAARVFAGCALGCAANAQTTPLPPPTVAGAHAQEHVTLAQALEAAWRRSLDATQASGLQQQSLANQSAADNWLAAAPSLLLAQREPSSARTGDARETEAGLALPLWRPGQRRISALAAQTDQVWAQAYAAAAQWRLAAQVRELAGQLEIASAQLRQAEVQRELLAGLANDVAQRVSAGDLAPSDALAAQAELLAAQSRAAELQRERQTHQANWLLLTGLHAWAELDMPRTGARDLSEHPEMILADIAVQRARQRVELVQAQRGAQPELGVSIRQERPGQGQPRQNSLAVSIKLPIGTQGYNQPQMAAAVAQQDLALSAQQRTQLQLQSELELAMRSLESSQAQADAEVSRAQLLGQRAQLLRKSFDAGETALPELLRAVAAAAQADAAATRQTTALALAQARVHQAQGILP